MIGPLLSRLRRLGLAWLLLIAGSLALANQVLLARPDLPNQPVWSQLGYHCSSAAQPRELDNARWQAVTGPIRFGITARPCWFRLQLRNPAPEPVTLWLRLRYPPLDDIRAWTRPLANADPHLDNWQEQRLGDQLPYDARPVRLRYPALPLTVPAHGEQTLLLRIETESAFVVPLLLSGETTFIEQLAQEEWWLGLFYGLSIGLLLYNLGLYLSLRERLPLLYLVHVASALGYFLVMDGIGYQVLWPTATPWNQYAQYVFAHLSFAFALYFARAYLKTSERPTLDRLLRWLAHTCLLIIPTCAVLPIRVSAVILTLAALLVGVLATAAGLLRAYDGTPHARLYVLSWGPPLALLLLWTLEVAGLPPIGSGLAGLQLGMALQLLLLSLGMANRINELKFNAVQLAQAHALAQTEARTRADFLAKMSHEIRTPMNGVLGMVQLLRETPLDAQQRHCVDTMQTSGQTLLAVINDVLDYAKMDAGKLTLEAMEFDLVELLTSTADLFRPLARERQLAFELELPTGPLWVRGDPTRLRQVLFNLLSNAFKFTAQGQVRLSLRSQVAADGRPEQRLEVSDTGIGIPADLQGQLFQPFTQADASITRQYGGTGLGLAICRQLVELMQGQIGVRSQPGQGACFWLDLHLPAGHAPGASPTPSPAQAPDGPLCAGAHPRVLVAEDNLTNRMVLTAMLRKLGIEPVVVDNGRKALNQVLAGNAFDLVLMDCEMPEMDGYSATRAIRDWEQREQRPRLPIVAVTAHALAEHRQLCFEAGMDDHIAKPIELTTLTEVLRRWCPQPATAS